MYFNNDSISEI